MTLEAEIVGKTNLILLKIDIFYSAPSLDRANGISLSIRKALDAGCCAPKRRHSHAKRIEVSLENIFKVPVMDKQLRMSCHQEREFTTHVMNWLPEIGFTNLIELSGSLPSPELDS